MSKFVKEQIINTGIQTDTIKKTEFGFEMKSWLASESGGSKKQPSAREMQDVMEKHYGPCKNNMWTGVKMLKYATLTDDDPNAD